MSVKTKDRHVSKNEVLQKSRELMSYILVLTRPREYNYKGEQIQKPGLLGEGQPFQVFGLDIVRCGKLIHSYCHQASKTDLKDKETFQARQEFYLQAVERCDSIFRQIDLCIFQYAKNNKKKRNSFEHLAKLTNSMKKSLQDRLNRDKLIYEQKYTSPKSYRRGR